MDEEKTITSPERDTVLVKALEASVKRLSSKNASLKNQMKELSDKVNSELESSVRKILLAFIGVADSHRNTEKLLNSLITDNIDEILGVSKAATEVTLADLTSMV